MKTAIQMVMEFIAKNPGSTKADILQGTGVKGIVLFNALKKLEKDGQIVSDNEGDDIKYSPADAAETAEEVEGQQDEETVEENKTDETETDEDTEEHEESNENDAEDDEVVDETKKVKASTTRDNSKYKFNGELYGKGPLVRAVVAQYVADNPTVTYAQLKEVFPNTLMKRFGVFEEIGKAKEIAGKGNRYFTKPEQTIKLKDKKVIVVCNQWTHALLQTFLKTAKDLGYKIK